MLGPVIGRHRPWSSGVVRRRVPVVALALCLAATMVPAAREQSPPPPQRATSHAPPSGRRGPGWRRRRRQSPRCGSTSPWTGSTRSCASGRDRTTPLAARIRLARLLAVVGQSAPGHRPVPVAARRNPRRRPASPPGARPCHRARAPAARGPVARRGVLLGRRAARLARHAGARRTARAGRRHSTGACSCSTRARVPVYLVGKETAAAVASPPEPTAVTMLPGGGVAIVGKTGLVVGQGTGPAARPIPLSGTWGGKARPVKKVRSMAALSDGSLLVVDRDYDGVLRCDPSSGACAPWGPAGKFRVVRVGPTDWVFLLDDRGQTVRVLDPAQRTITVVGPDRRRHETRGRGGSGRRSRRTASTCSTRARNASSSCTSGSPPTAASARRSEAC